MKEEQYIRVRVTTGAKKQQIEKKKDIYHISVKEKPQNGNANSRVRQLLATELGCTQKQLRLVKGHTTPSKTYLLRNT